MKGLLCAESPGEDAEIVNGSCPGKCTEDEYERLASGVWGLLPREI